MRILFANIGLPIEAPYLNPIHLQTLAGQVAHEFPQADARIVDECANDDSARAIEELAPTDILIAAVSDVVGLDRLLGLVASRQDALTIAITGELVTALGPQGIGERLRQLNKSEIYIFLGREANWLCDFIRSVVSGTPVIAPYVFHVRAPEAILSPLPRDSTSGRLLFSHQIVDASRTRGLFLLVEGLTRGCENHCLYCHLQNHDLTRGVVQHLIPPSGSVVETIRTFGDSCLIFFTDENFFGGRTRGEIEDRAEQIASLAREVQEAEVAALLAVDTRVDSVPLALIQDPSLRSMRKAAWDALQAAGLIYVYLGIESFSPSQLSRYGKASEWSSIDLALDEMAARNLAFTAGLILLDPLGTVDEVEESLNFINSRKLFARIASPLKVLRVQNASAYARLLRRRLSFAADADLSEIDILDLCQDSRMRTVMQRVAPIHSLFAKAGYRHSDSPAYAAILSRALGISCPIPEMVGSVECEILSAAIKEKDEEKFNGYSRLRLEALVSDVCSWLRSIHEAMGDPRARKVISYYMEVFNLLEARGF